MIRSSAVLRPPRKILIGSAFDERQLSQLTPEAYDLVITNPPYVRYQGRNGLGAGTSAVRTALKHAIEARAATREAFVWRKLADAYSGFSDLSVPSWLLAGLMVRPGGRLALVAPATWRSRDYADVVRYLLLRCFVLETIVEDTQPGWFSDALVRTHLIVARRLGEDAATPLCTREHWASIKWLRVAPHAADEHSLVGSAFRQARPEAHFASCLNSSVRELVNGIEITAFELASEWDRLQSRIRRRRWYQQLEAGSEDLRLFTSASDSVAKFLPPPFKKMLPAGVQPGELLTLKEAGIQVGQGLRTGCNAFFYVDVCGPEEGGRVRVRGSARLGATEFFAPAEALRPVVRRQAEVHCVADDNVPSGRVLDLRSWVLPEHEDGVEAARSTYERSAQPLPRTMPDDLAAFVRRAASQTIPGSDKLIPKLTAVRTNVRFAGRRGQPPRFWYMLPDFSPRHLPAAFVPRVIHHSPWTERNIDPPVLIDANFSTFLSGGEGWDRYSVKALLNSVWCCVFMELLGTPLGGGALKLEATHLRQMVVPRLDWDEKRALSAAGRSLTRDSADVHAQINAIVLSAVVRKSASHTALPGIAKDMSSRAHSMRTARQKATS